MARRKILTDEQIAKLAPRTSAYPDPELAGHYIRVRPTGRRVFCVVARDPNGKQVWNTLGDGSVYNVAEARAAARDAIKAIKTGSSRSGPNRPDSVATEMPNIPSRPVLRSAFQLFFQCLPPSGSVMSSTPRPSVSLSSSTDQSRVR